MITFILYYIICGVVFNFVFDLMVNWLASNDPEHEGLRFTMSERLIIVFTWPIHFVRLLRGIIKTIINS
jgi:hypothetical protein